MAASPEEDLVSNGWLLYKVRRGELLLLTDPDNEEALDSALASPLFEGGTSQWFSRLIAVTPNGWEILIFERQHLAAVHTMLR